MGKKRKKKKTPDTIKPSELNIPNELHKDAIHNGIKTGAHKDKSKVIPRKKKYKNLDY